MKVLTVVGNRPQFVKAAPLSMAFRDHGIEEIMLHTGQHYDRELSQVFFEDLGLHEPRYSLDLRTADPDPIRKQAQKILSAEQPNWVVVYGDTNSTFAGAVAAARLNFSLAHVEAGLRSGDLTMPEERNRIQVDRLADLLFCPDQRSAENLVLEGVEGRREMVGDVMADATMRLTPVARRRSRVIERLQLESRAYLVVTVHREANTLQPRLGRLVEGLNRLEEKIVFPVHPRTREALNREHLQLGSHIKLEPPLGYLDFAALASQARVILTDSGGLQKEAYWYGVPCVTLRPSTEWVDTVAVGANVLVNDVPARIAAAVKQARMPAERPQLYGDGRAAERIAEVLVTLSP
jgi:UDP-N-acetylglucosamine 2-epimerase